jgi:hypothetical protein
MEKLVIFFIGLLLVIIGTSTFIIFDNMPGEPQPLTINQPQEPVIKIGSSGEVKQFYENLRFNHNNISYSFSDECQQDTIAKMMDAFRIISSQTQIITFYEDEKPDIRISCSEQSIQKSKNVFIAGEGGPTEFINSTDFPVILQGEILLYRKSSCDRPIVELHELLHVFGFDHNTNPSSIMYPYADCDQTLNSEYTDFLKNLYSMPAEADLYFEEVNATKSGRYLNFEVTVSNKGIIDSKNVSITITDKINDEEIKSFSLGDINFGTGKKFSVQNLRLPGRSISEIGFILKSSTQEYSSENNRVIASLDGL